MKNGYLLLLFFALLFAAIVSLNLQREYVPVNVTDNFTAPTPLMSVPDGSPSGTEDETEEESGWWLHKGHSYVSYISGEGSEGVSMNNSSVNNNSVNAYVDLMILLNGEDANSFPGKELASGSKVTIEYCVTNTGNAELDDVVITDTVFGNIGEYESLHSGESISFTSSVSVQEGQFSSTGKVAAFNESMSQTCSDEHSLYYFGVKDQEDPVAEIPEFPTIFLPLAMILGLVIIFGRRV